MLTNHISLLKERLKKKEDLIDEIALITTSEVYKLKGIEMNTSTKKKTDPVLPLNLKFNWQDINRLLKVTGFEDEPIKVPTPPPVEVKPLKRYMWDT